MNMYLSLIFCYGISKYAYLAEVTVPLVNAHMQLSSSQFTNFMLSTQN